MNGASDVWLESHDGVILRGRLWQPEGSGPWPVLLMRQPYGRAIASTVTYAHPSWYASHGYAVLVQDVRGRGESGGRFGGFSQEAPDSAASIAWLRQQPWCNGRVGCYGFSYQGLTQLLQGDTEQLPDALAPAMAGLDERLHWASEGGCHWWALAMGWGLQLAAQGCRQRGDQEGWRAIRLSLESGGFLRDGLALLQAHDPDGMVLGWLRHDPSSPAGWIRHEPVAELWQRPMLLIGGWHDPHLRGVLDLWQRARGAGAAPLLRIGAWSHLAWQGGIDRLQLTFFNRHLRGDASDAPPDPTAGAEQRLDSPICLQDLGDGSWKVRSPEQHRAMRWALSSNGLAAIDANEGQLSTTAANGAGRVVVVHDPWRPLPGRGGHLGLDAGAVDRADLDQRGDVACFNTPVLIEPMELLGEPLLLLDASADQPGFDLCAALSVVGPDGSVRQLSTGFSRHLGEGCLQAQRRRVRLQPLLLSLRAGERLRLSIGLTAWPQIAVNPGDGSGPLGPSGPDHRVISVELRLADASLSILSMLGAN